MTVDETSREMLHLLEPLTRTERFQALAYLMQRLQWDEENKAEDAKGEAMFEDRE